MLEKEQDLLSKSEKPNVSNWHNVSEIADIDFWFGAKYRGSYWQRLQLDLDGIERICRAGNLPPVILRNDNWNPPTVNTPEVIAPGLSAFKKTSFQRDPNLPEREKNLYRLTATNEVIPFKGYNIPIGWVIYLKDRKLIYDYQAKHLRAPKQEEEKYFIKEFDSVLKDALVNVAINESLASRITNKEERIAKVSRLLIMQAVAALPGGLVTFDSLPAFLVSELANNGIWQEIYRLTGLTLEHWGVSKAKKIGLPFKRIPDGEHRLIAYLWRLANFPDRVEEEYRHLDVAKTLVVTAIPGGLLFEDLYKTYQAIVRQRGSLVRLR